tara:strand:+ start:385 stop:1011 length:627 start_codon:yes stop_codon:yes gene_type:complete
MKIKQIFLISLISLACSPTVLSCEDSYQLVRNHYNTQLLLEGEIKDLAINYQNDFENTIVSIDFENKDSALYVFDNLERLAPTYLETDTDYMENLIEIYEDNLFDDREYKIHENILQMKDALIEYEKLNLRTMKILYEKDAIGQKMIIEFAEALGLQEISLEDYLKEYLDDFSDYNNLGEDYSIEYDEYLKIESKFYNLNSSTTCNEK